MRKINRWQQIAAQAGLLLIGLFVILPIWSLAQMAFDGSIMGWPLTFRFWPAQFSIQPFLDMWVHPAQSLSFLSALKNSLFVSGGAALLSVLLGASMAYAFARYRFPGRRIGLFGLLLGALLPPVALMTPLFVLLSSLGIRNSLWGLMIVYAAFSMPFCIWNMRAGFQSVPKELEESAFLDGAAPLVAFTRITLPLALPSLGLAALVAFLTGYSEFAMAWLFIDQSQDVTLAMSLSGMYNMISNWSNLAALAVMTSIPVVIVFIGLQRYLLDRLLIGQIKD